MTWIIFAVAAGIVWLWWRWQEGILARRREDAVRRAEFGKNPMDLPSGERTRGLLDEIAVYYREMTDVSGDAQTDPVTWNDLEMDEVFLRVNHTRSYIGEQVLFRRLHAGPAREDIGNEERLEEKIAFFMKEEAARESMEMSLARIGKRREDYYLPVFLGNAKSLKVEHLWLYRALQLLLAGSFLTGMLSQNPVCLAVFIGTALVNAALYAVSREKYEVYLYALGSVKELLRFCRKLTEDPEWMRRFGTERLVQAVGSLKKMEHLIGSFQVKKAGVLTGDVMELLRDYVIGATLWDITLFQRIINLIDGKQESLNVLYETAGEADMAVSVASFRRSVPKYCIPVFADGGGVCAKGLYHPLLREPVRNDIILERGCMITGANASGKSTFIKALAVNAILAQTIHTCTAETFCMPRMQVLTSMAVRDDIVSGESYYIREAGYLKRIVMAASGPARVFCLIDEILRGTNTEERLAASEAVCRYLAVYNCIAVVATHDPELAESMRGLYDCYHFKSEIRGSDICFDYKIYRGLGVNRNAVRILAYMGFPGEIVEMAERLCGPDGGGDQPAEFQTGK